MKKFILASLVLFFGTSTVSAFDGVFLDQVQHKIFENKKITMSEAKMLLELSSESPQKKIEAIVQRFETREIMSSEDSSIQEINEPVVEKARRDFSFLEQPQKETAVYLFEISSRNFSSSLENVRMRQSVAREKAMRYRRIFPISTYY